MFLLMLKDLTEKRTQAGIFLKEGQQNQKPPSRDGGVGVGCWVGGRSKRKTMVTHGPLCGHSSKRMVLRKAATATVQPCVGIVIM